MKVFQIRLITDPKPPAKSILRPPSGQRRQQGEQAQECYDEAFKVAETYQVHDSDSEYYPIWTVVIDRLRLAGSQRMLDIGCAPGLFVQALLEAGVVESYVGAALSEVGVARAKERAPAFRCEHRERIRGAISSSS